MEIGALDLAAFGPFTGRVLEFDHSAGRLHVVYGANEAGKSSALRGLRAWLYGIPERTPDNFLHENDKLRVGGRLRDTRGKELVCLRRKGRKHTLLSAQGEPIEESALQRFVDGVSEELFVTLFGIDHGALVRGGQEILAQKGELGQALFSASLGNAVLHGVLAELDQEADALFRPQGSKPEINAALRRHAELQRELREVSLSSRDWDERRRALARTSAELAQLQDALVRARAELNRLRRIQRCLPGLRRRNGLLHKVSDLGEVVLLPADFGERRRTAVAELDKARALARQARDRVRNLQEQLEGLAPRQDVLALAESIEAFHARLGSHLKALQDRPHLRARHTQLLAEAANLLRDLRPGMTLEEAQTLRPALNRRVRLTELGNRYEALSARVRQAEKAQRETDARWEQLRRASVRVTAIDAPEGLRRAVRAARKAGDLDAALRFAGDEMKALQDYCSRELARIMLWDGTLEEICDLPLPLSETIARFEQQFEELEVRAMRLEERRQEAAAALHETGQALDALRRAGAPPSEQDLAAARSARDELWALLRRQWLDGEDVGAQAHRLDADRLLPEAFEFRLLAADEVADRLRREADRVHQQASLLTGQAAARERAEALGRDLATCAGERARLDAAWRDAWAPATIEPQTPREMRAWLDRLEKLQERVGQLQVQRARANELERSRDALIVSLRQELGALGREAVTAGSLEAELAASEAVLEDLEHGLRRRDELEDMRKTVAAEHQAAIEEFQAWRARWQEAVAGLGLGQDAPPAEAVDMLERIGQLFRKLDEAGELRIRIEGIDADGTGFTAQVRDLVKRVAPDLANLPVAEVVQRLIALLSDSRIQEAGRQRLTAEIDKTQGELQAATTTCDTMRERLDALCREARCEDPAALEPAEQRSADYLQLKNAIASLEQDLLAQGEGASLEELEAQAAAVDPDALPGQIEVLHRRIRDELEPRQTALADARGQERTKVELMDGGDAAAAIAEQIQSLVASIRAQSEQYIRVKLAARILRNEIERYRRENQGPLLARAAEHFAVLTRGSFTGLQVDFNAQDEAVLAGIRPSAARVHVEGMSAGTRDQLYLALRLASLEKYLETAEPMPFIVDDILVHFDDARAQATLGVLAELARHTQVILFTHHARLVEQAQGLEAAVPVTVHAL